MHEKATGKHNIFYLSKIIYNTYKLYICINNLNEVIVFEVIMLSSRCRLTKITASNMTGFFFFLSCWSVQSSGNMDYWCCSWWPPRIWRRVLMLKAPGTSNTGFRKVKVGLTWKPLPWGLGSTGKYYASHQDGVGEKQSIVTPFCATYKPQQWPTWQDVPKFGLVGLNP